MARGAQPVRPWSYINGPIDRCWDDPSAHGRNKQSSAVGFYLGAGIR